MVSETTNFFFQSPRDTENYPHGANCIWIIRSDIGTILRLSWLTFAVEEHGSCEYDYVEIFDDDGTTNGTAIGRYDFLVTKLAKFWRKRIHSITISNLLFI